MPRARRVSLRFDAIWKRLSPRETSVPLSDINPVCVKKSTRAVRHRWLGWNVRKVWGADMAGDWIKMRIDLQSHPKVVRILSATQSDKFRVIGGLHAVWSVFDTHSEDGKLSGYTPMALDHVIGWDGFAQAMIDVGWLEWDGLETLAMPEFGEHNGKSAKRRAEDQKRKKNSRNCPQDVRNESDKDADEDGTREEKRRYIKTKAKSADRFDDFWSAWPSTARKTAKSKCREKWTTFGLDDVADRIVAHVTAMRSTKQWLDGYEPAPMTYLNQRRWEDTDPDPTGGPGGGMNGFAAELGLERFGQML